MNSKKCCHCGKIKPVSDFYKNRSKKDGFQHRCKDCSDEATIASRRTKKGLVSRIYADQKNNSKRRGHRLPEYTKNELQDWLFSQTLFHELYDEWVRSGYKKRLTPSVDRKYDDIHYCMRNIQLMTWGDNRDKQSADFRTGKLNTAIPNRQVIKYTKNGEFLYEYHSAREASRSTGISSSNIALVCKGKRNYAGGYKWKYKNEEKMNDE